MAEKIAGFELEVSVVEFIPHVRVTMENGTVVVDTDQVSCTGLENLSAVFKRAASIALKQFEDQSMKRMDDLRMERRRSEAPQEG
jgi:predicted transcriptional regulator of viral defense system